MKTCDHLLKEICETQGVEFEDLNKWFVEGFRIGWERGQSEILLGLHAYMGYRP